MNSPRGSLWRQWDLHVHTPDSVIHRYEGADPWNQFLDELEHLPRFFKVIGINDYIFLDGYRRILAEKAAGRLKNIELFLPVIELRIDKFGGTNNHLSRVNYHVIFSDELTPDVIEHQFLNALPRGYQLSPALDTIPSKLSDAEARRLAKSKELHAVLRGLVQTYRDLYDSVNKFIDTNPLANQKFQLNFDVGIVDAGFEAEFFDIISQGLAGTFCGIEPGTKLLREILSGHDFTKEDGIEAFLNDLINALHQDRRETGKAVRVKDQLRKGKTVQALYNFIFSLAYLKPRYELRMGRKELSELSPGERGTLLLVFYLLVDKDDIPLLIDQPEENLDNQTVFELLVPCIKEAKQRRQLFLVTHNPNLAVVCDAEQIIWADLQKNQNYRMRYLSGAIENPQINHAIVDILEGTMPAFHNRQNKYFPIP